jgi:RNA polymerase sigma-70 factor (ECF subfamily)
MLPPSAPCETLPDKNQERWFTTEVQAHESSLRSYLRGSFPSVRDVDDVVQESYLRVWKVCASKPIHSAKAFLFTVARRLALDHWRHAQALPVESLGQFSNVSALEDKSEIEDLGQRERIQLLAEAISGLPTRCREVFILYKVEGHSRKEAARQLGLSEKTVEAHTARAMRHCEAFFRRRGIKGMFHHETR